MEILTTRDPACPPDHRFGGWRVELVEDGQWASRLWILDKEMRIGGAPVRIGGISSVETAEAHRGKGLASKVMDAALALMAREGFHASVLHGIPDFYHRFGFAVCMPEYEVRIPTMQAEKASGPCRLRDPIDIDLPAIARLYNGENQARTGSIVRDPSTWLGFPRSVGFFTRPVTRVAVDAKDRVTGYVVWDDASDRCRAAEAGGLGGDALGAILRGLADRAVELRKEEVVLALPPDHALAVFARRYGCEARIRYPRNGEFMGRVINLEPFLERVAEGMARGTDLSLPDGRIAFATDLGPCALEVAKGRAKAAFGAHSPADIDAARIGQGALFQLAMGYRTARDLHSGGELQGDPDQIDLLSAWFPLRHPCMYWPDRF